MLDNIEMRILVQERENASVQYRKKRSSCLFSQECGGGIRQA